MNFLPASRGSFWQKAGFLRSVMSPLFIPPCTTFISSCSFFPKLWHCSFQYQLNHTDCGGVPCLWMLLHNTTLCINGQILSKQDYVLTPFLCGPCSALSECLSADEIIIATKRNTNTKYVPNVSNTLGSETDNLPMLSSLFLSSKPTKNVVWSPFLPLRRLSQKYSDL